MGSITEINPNSTFIKYDTGKNMVSLVEPDFILGLGKVLTHGAEKYEVDNWKLNTDIRRYKDSALRHLYAYLEGQLLDEDSGLPHLDHLSANIMFLRHFEKEKGRI